MSLTVYAQQGTKVANGSGSQVLLSEPIPANFWATVGAVRYLSANFQANGSGGECRLLLNNQIIGGFGSNGQLSIERGGAEIKAKAVRIDNDTVRVFASHTCNFQPRDSNSIAGLSDPSNAGYTDVSVNFAQETPYHGEGKADQLADDQIVQLLLHAE